VLNVWPLSLLDVNKISFDEPEIVSVHTTYTFLPFEKISGPNELLVLLLRLIVLLNVWPLS
jgi:hypothetical protein